MKWLIVCIFVLMPFKTFSFKKKVLIEKSKIIECNENKVANKKNILNYLLTKVDSNKAKRLLAICVNETGLKSKYYKLNNLCCIRYGARAKYYTNYYGVYDNWTDCLQDLIEYEVKYGKRSWYNRFNKKLNIIINQL